MPMTPLPLETCRKLKEAGFEFPECEKWWDKEYPAITEQKFRVMIKGELLYADSGGADTYDKPSDIATPCPSTDELLAVMPDETSLQKTMGEKQKWHYIASVDDAITEFGDTPSEALAHLLLKLREEGIL